MKTRTATDSLIAADLAQTPAPPADKLEAITVAAGQLRELQLRGEELNQSLEKISSEQRRLAEQVLPALMDEAQITQLRLEDGATLSREDAVFASIAKADANAAAGWLVKNGYGSIVKAAFLIPVEKGDVRLQARVRNLLRKAKIAYEETSTVHNQTLRAFAKESVAEGRALPDSIKVHIQPTVKLALRKPR